VARTRRKVRGCAVRECSAKHYAKAYCKKHYTQIARHNRLTPERERGVVRVCLVEHCGRTDTVGQYCRKHARQIRVHGRLTPEREHQMGNQGCGVTGCPNEHRARGYCVKHYNQMRWQRIKDQLARYRELEALHARGSFRG